MKIYSINYERLVILLLPTFLREQTIFAIVKTLIISVSALHSSFLRQREVNLLRIHRNGQVCNLRRLLNDELDSVLRRISISNAEMEGGWVFVMNESATNQVLIDDDDVMVYSEDLNIAKIDAFSVTVPWLKSETALTSRLRNYLNQYKLLSKEYIIHYE